MGNSPKRVLLTGGSGFIGGNLLASEVTSNWQVFAPGHRELDLLDERAVREFIQDKGVQIVIHAACKPGHRNAIDRSDLLSTNTRMFFSLARNSHLFEKMIVLGSGAIYDNRYFEPKMGEDSYDQHVPVDDHGLSKYVIAKYLEKTDNIFDLRIFGIYGKNEDYQIRFISNMICKALFELPLTMKQDRYFDYLYVDDLAPILMHVVDKGLPWRSMNVTPDKSVRLSEIAQMVLSVLNKPHLPIQIAVAGLGSEYSGDNSRFRREFPDFQFTELRTGIQNLANWYTSRLSTIDRQKLLVDP